MKRAAASILAMALALCLAACSGPGVPSDTDPVALGESLTAKAEALPDITVVSSENEYATGAELFPYLSDMDYAKVAGFYLAYSTAGSAEEIAVISVKDPADLAEARASLEAHLENRLGIFRTYDPSQAAMVEDAKIVAVGDTAALFICANAEALSSAFREAMGQ